MGILPTGFDDLDDDTIRASFLHVLERPLSKMY